MAKGPEKQIKVDSVFSKPEGLAAYTNGPLQTENIGEVKVEEKPKGKVTRLTVADLTDDMGRVLFS